MNGQCLDAHILKTFSQIHDNLGILIPSKPCLDCNRLTHSLHHSLGDGDQLIRFTQHSGPGSTSCNLSHRASEIYINDIGPMTAGNLGGMVNHPGRFHH